MNKYEVLGCVGEGAYGIVLKCRNRESGDLVAIKKFKESDEDEAVKKTTLREVKILRLLRNHSCIVNLKEAFRRKSRLYLVFEYVGRNLLEVLEEHPKGLSTELTRRYMYMLVSAIHGCHIAKVLHRDIKPENLLINCRERCLKLCDFGFARMATDGIESKGYTDYVATRWYRSPELLLATTAYTEKVDIWSLGCIMAEMLNATALFPGDSELDQLFLIQRSLGNFDSHQVNLFKSNPRFSSYTLPTVSRLELFDHKFQGKLNKRGINFMKSLLVLSPDNRVAASKALQHSWFDGLDVADQSNSSNIPTCEGIYNEVYGGSTASVCSRIRAGSNTKSSTQWKSCRRKSIQVGTNVFQKKIASHNNNNKTFDNNKRISQSSCVVERKDPTGKETTERKRIALRQGKVSTKSTSDENIRPNPTTSTTSFISISSKGTAVDSTSKSSKRVAICSIGNSHNPVIDLNCESTSPTTSRVSRDSDVDQTITKRTSNISTSTSSNVIKELCCVNSKQKRSDNEHQSTSIHTINELITSSQSPSPGDSELLRNSSIPSSNSHYFGSEASRGLTAEVTTDDEGSNSTESVSVNINRNRTTPGTSTVESLLPKMLTAADLTGDSQSDASEDCNVTSVSVNDNKIKTTSLSATSTREVDVSRQKLLTAADLTSDSQSDSEEVIPRNPIIKNAEVTSLSTTLTEGSVLESKAVEIDRNRQQFLTAADLTSGCDSSDERQHQQQHLSTSKHSEDVNTFPSKKLLTTASSDDVNLGLHQQHLPTSNSQLVVTCEQRQQQQQQQQQQNSSHESYPSKGRDVSQSLLPKRSSCSSEDGGLLTYSGWGNQYNNTNSCRPSEGSSDQIISLRKRPVNENTQHKLTTPQQDVVLNTDVSIGGLDQVISLRKRPTSGSSPSQRQIAATLPSESDSVMVSSDSVLSVSCGISDRLLVLSNNNSQTTTGEDISLTALQRSTTRDVLINLPEPNQLSIETVMKSVTKPVIRSGGGFLSKDSTKVNMEMTSKPIKNCSPVCDDTESEILIHRRPGSGLPRPSSGSNSTEKKKFKIPNTVDELDGEQTLRLPGSGLPRHSEIPKDEREVTRTITRPGSGSYATDRRKSFSKLSNPVGDDIENDTTLRKPSGGLLHAPRPGSGLPRHSELPRNEREAARTMARPRSGSYATERRKSRTTTTVGETDSDSILRRPGSGLPRDERAGRPGSGSHSTDRRKSFTKLYNTGSDETGLDLTLKRPGSGLLQSDTSKEERDIIRAGFNEHPSSALTLSSSSFAPYQSFKVKHLPQLDRETTAENSGRPHSGTLFLSSLAKSQAARTQKSHQNSNKLQRAKPSLFPSNRDFSSESSTTLHPHHHSATFMQAGVVCVLVLLFYSEKKKKKKNKNR